MSNAGSRLKTKVDVPIDLPIDPFEGYRPEYWREEDVHPRLKFQYHPSKGINQICFEFYHTSDPSKSKVHSYLWYAPITGTELAAKILKSVKEAMPHLSWIAIFEIFLSKMREESPECSYLCHTCGRDLISSGG